jgi:hypothetical protein
MKKNKPIKFPSKYKYGFRIAGEPANRALFLNRFWYPIIIKRPICWLKGHHNKIIWPFGLKIKICIRCGKTFYQKKTTEKYPNGIFGGVVGELYGVKFKTTKRAPTIYVDMLKPIKRG